MELQTKVFDVDGVPVVHISGELDMTTSGQVLETVLELTRRGSREIILNLDDVAYIDSTGLGTMVGLLKRLTDQGGHLCLAANNPLVDRVFTLTGLSQVFRLEHTDHDAARTLHAAASRAGAS